MAVRGGFAQGLFCLVLLFLVAGCASGPTPIHVEGSIAAAKDLNPDLDGRPSPVVVRVYQLKSPSSFQNADFFALYDKDAATLGSDLISRDEIEMQPGETRKYNVDLDPATHFVGVMAAYRDLDKARWRAVVQVPDKKKIPLSIKLDSLAVSVSIAK